jgi:hypothetical protein
VKYYLLSILLVCGVVGCRDDEDLFYDLQTGNAMVIEAFALKDSFCGTSHTVTNLVPGRTRKREIDACLESIKIQDCRAWNVKDPTPDACKRISFRF